MVDPAFGSIWLDTSTSAWRATIDFAPVGSQVSVHIFDAGEYGPDDWQRRCFLELNRRFPDLKKAIEMPLWNEYEWIRKDWGLASQPVSSPEEIWKVAKLVAIVISSEQSNSGVDFSLNYRIDWENDDHDLNVLFKDWQVLEVAMEG